MANLNVIGIEKNDYNLYTGQLLQINGISTSYTILADGVFTLRAQLGNATAGLVGAERVWLDISIISVLTGDESLLPQLFVDVPVGETMVMIVSEPYLVKIGDIIKVKAYSNKSSDNSVGGCVESLQIGQ